MTIYTSFSPLKGKEVHECIGLQLVNKLTQQY